MYGLPQAGKIANYCLTTNPAPHGCHQFRHTAVFWKHKWLPVIFSLVVDDFGVKYIGKQHADHLIESIRKYYPVYVDSTVGL